MEQEIFDFESMINDMSKDVLENPVFQLYLAYALIQRCAKFAKEFEYVPPSNDE